MSIIRDSKPVDVVGVLSNPCGRCSATGKIAFLAEDGSPAESWCPVCKGEGYIRTLETQGAQSLSLPSTRTYADGVAVSGTLNTGARRRK